MLQMQSAWLCTEAATSLPLVLTCKRKGEKVLGDLGALHGIKPTLKRRSALPSSQPEDERTAGLSFA